MEQLTLYKTLFSNFITQRRKGVKDGVLLADCAFPTMLLLGFFMVKKQEKRSGLLIAYRPLRLRASA
jgi:hypothetical protein